jgi:ATP-dependent DNA helicase RecQ
MIEQAKLALKKYFGYDAFRPMQADIIQAIFDKRDVVVLMPTGGGKSICYQIPALCLDGVAVIVSPLIALMKDQVTGLQANGISAAFMNSSQHLDEVRQVEHDALAGRIKILYVSPEKLVSQGFQPFLKRLKINLFAIDEAHCISAWGHDFRPEYTQLKFLREQFAGIPIMALTATADKLTRKDIVTQLGLPDPQVYIASFDRPNISLKVTGGQKRIEQIERFLAKNKDQSGIIYCLSRKSCEDLAEKLNQRGHRAAYYHAQMPAQIRSKVQEDFINDRIPVICATIAFGMGIDKSNVRFVIHYNLPRNVEGYYQEIGRAGRDGLPAEALLMFSYADVMSYRDMIQEGEGDQGQKDLKLAKLQRMYEFAEAPVCRRKTVLAYFDEQYDRDCGNCDVCLNPPRQFDGTVAAQKALSAIKRTDEKVGMVMLVNILRGSQNREILDKGYNTIKTYGAGREYSYDEWIYLVMQMLHLGLVEIAYDQTNQLKVTPMGLQVLYEGRKVPLALPPDAAEKEKEARKKAEPKVDKKTLLRDELFARLRTVRTGLAQQLGVPPYQVFSDATLSEMAEKRPLTDADLLFVSGVGERKLQLYGDAFLTVIRDYVREQANNGVRVEGSSPFLSYDLYRSGKSVEAIAVERNISTTTVQSHLATMYERGELLDSREWVSADASDMIRGSLGLFEEPFVMKEIFEHHKQRFSFDEIRWAIAEHRRERLKNESVK